MPVEHTTQYIPAKPMHDPREPYEWFQRDLNEWERKYGHLNPVNAEPPRDPRD